MFSQYNEEEIILNFFGDRRGSFLDIGAWDGIELSNTRALALRGWRGLLVEPDPVAFSKLMENKRVSNNLACVNAAIGPTREIRSFYAQKEWGGTLNPDYINYGTRGFTGAHYVLTMCPYDLVQIGQKLDMMYEFVSLDAEWIDEEILVESEVMLMHTQLLCVEVNDGKFQPQDPMPTICRNLGFTREIGRTPCNLLVAR